MINARLKGRVLFRCDSNRQIGAGHFVRSLALAAMLRKNFTCSFIMRNPSEPVKKNVKQSGFELINLKSKGDIRSEARLIRSSFLRENDTLVLDGYDFDFHYQKILKQKKIKLVLIDDIYPPKTAADVIINHAPGANPARYPGNIKLCLGCEFVLLRKPFLEESLKKRVIRKANTAFVCFGGADIHNISTKALLGLKDNQRISKVHLVIGNDFTDKDEVVNLVKTFRKPKVILHQNLDAQKLLQVLKDSQIAICPASGILLEVFCTGLGVITGFFADNQKHAADYVKKIKAASVIGDFTQARAEVLREKISELTTKVIRQQITVQKKLIDGKSTGRLLNVFMHLHFSSALVMRKALPKDVMTYFHWTNDPEVRANSINSGSIPLAIHKKWFESKISNQDARLFIFEVNGDPVGQVRLLWEHDYWLINYSVDSNYRNMGLGTLMIKQVLTAPELKDASFKALVKPGNTGSVKIFLRTGFQFAGTEKIKRQRLNIYRK